ncbi:nucleotidyltransferase [Anaerocolumna xylanovorans]|uniref:Nucleotidyltransferase domain-containing protein n=1 Tax=Anaerocolumna xylanovorans DSM 12503 TaxID=1121345 RepID=A0A1M7XWL9_9FIRM|nr:nucleotidyltransferase [Anaerocolumna xylanovorans]SHO43191.1 hypothetical protein SAMN02745217_00124 [Anaerocolumna xylanovorans DSM 12503]
MGNIKPEVQEKYNKAVESFVMNIKSDPNVIAVIVCGSLAYDVVWEKSDIDTTVIVRDQVLKKASYCIAEDDIVINVNLITRSDFKRGFERMKGGSFLQSYYSRGKMVFTSDESLKDYFEEMKIMDRGDVNLFLFYAACELVGISEKCQKWIEVKDNPLYAQYYLLKAADVIARMEVCKTGEAPSREAILKAVTLSEKLMEPFYQEAMAHHFTKEEVNRCIALIDNYLEANLDAIKEPVIDYMKDGELKTLTLLTNHFHTDGHFIVSIFDYLAEKGIIERVSQTIRITPKSRLAVEELGFLYIP